MTETQRILQELLMSTGTTRAELAARLGVSAETVSRWAAGATAMPTEMLIAAAAVCGRRMTINLRDVDPHAVAQVGENLDVGPTARLIKLLGDDGWRACRDGMVAAAFVGKRGVLIGPIAAASAGAPIAHAMPRVDLLVSEDDRPGIEDTLREIGARPGEAHRQGDEVRHVWSYGQGTLTIRDRAASLTGTGVREVRQRAFDTYLNADLDPGAQVWFPAIEDLIRICIHSPWAEDRDCVPGLSAVLASGRYRTRENEAPAPELYLA
jgi:transcriptional regulator with XRE-family HTH domain